MSDLVLNYLSKNKNPKDLKIILKSDLVPRRKIVVLDRQVVKYFTNYDKYQHQKIVDFRDKVLKDYDKSSNIITLIAAFYEGGKGVFENHFEKKNNAHLDLRGLDEYFKYALVDQEYLFKNMKEAANTFTYDSGVQIRIRKYTKIIKMTYEIYIELKINEFKGEDVIKQTEKLKEEMDRHEVCISDPIAQYCFSLLTNYENAKNIFKVKDLKHELKDSDLQKKIYNVYADLRLLMFIQEIKSHIPEGIELCIVSHDTALNQFNSDLENSIKKLLVRKDKQERNINWFEMSINFDIFNPKIFTRDEFEHFKNLFYKWSGN